MASITLSCKSAEQPPIPDSPPPSIPLSDGSAQGRTITVPLGSETPTSPRTPHSQSPSSRNVDRFADAALHRPGTLQIPSLLEEITAECRTIEAQLPAPNGRRTLSAMVQDLTHGYAELRDEVNRLKQQNEHLQSKCCESQADGLDPTPSMSSKRARRPSPARWRVKGAYDIFGRRSMQSGSRSFEPGTMTASGGTGAAEDAMGVASNPEDSRRSKGQRNTTQSESEDDESKDVQCDRQRIGDASNGIIVPSSRSCAKEAIRSKSDLQEHGRAATLCYKILESKPCQAFMLILTFLMLFGGDLWNATTEAKTDAVYEGFLIVCLLCFSTEWIMNNISSALQTPKYTCSLFFFLDLIATASIILEIAMTAGNNMTDQGPIARAARTARVGTRAGRSTRLIRIFKALRLVRLSRVLKTLPGSKVKHGDGSQTAEAEPEQLQRADTIGAQIGASTTKKAVIMILCMLVSLPLLERDEASQGSCNAEFVVALEAFARSEGVLGNCSRLRDEAGIWFDPGAALIDFSQNVKTGLTLNGLIYAIIDGCELFREPDLMGYTDDPELQLLAEQRRGTEIQALPCNAKYLDSDGDGSDDRSSTYLLYDARQEAILDSWFAMGFTMAIIVLLLIFSVVFSSDAEVIAGQLVTPMKEIMQDMTYTANMELEKVRSDEDIAVSEVYEIRKLQSSFQALKGALASFAKFTPLEVVRHLLALGAEATLGVTQRNVSIFFSDIAGFTTICEGTPPKQVLALLNEYFEAMVSIIIEEQGTMLEFIGDAILAIWNAPRHVPDHAHRAITATLRMQALLEDLRKNWASQGKPTVRVRVGIHSAKVFVGNLGSRMRMKYGVLGDGVNLASRLEELNKRYVTEILVSQDVTKEEGIRNAFVFRPVDLVVVKGRKAPTPIYEALAIRASASERTLQIATHSDQAMQAYLRRDFEAAIESLQQVRQLKGGSDHAGDVLTERCNGFIRVPPPPAWNGAEVLHEKTF